MLHERCCLTCTADAGAKSCWRTSTFLAPCWRKCAHRQVTLARPMQPCLACRFRSAASPATSRPHSSVRAVPHRGRSKTPMAPAVSCSCTRVARRRDRIMACSPRWPRKPAAVWNSPLKAAYFPPARRCSGCVMDWASSNRPVTSKLWRPACRTAAASCWYQHLPAWAHPGGMRTRVAPSWASRAAPAAPIWHVPRWKPSRCNRRSC